MPRGGPKWLNKTEATRDKSKKQETRLAKILKGHTTFNSGATLGQNDVVTPELEVEAKTTKFKQYTLKLEELEKMEQKCSVKKLPVFVIAFENSQEHEYAVIKFSDLEMLIK